MNECEKYREMISAMLDGELDAVQSEQLIEHMSSCAECREIYELFSAVSGQSVWELPEVPEGLHGHIMSGVKAAAAGRKRRGRVTYLRPLATAAACLVLIAGVIFGVPRFFRAGSSSPAAFNTSVAANNAAPPAAAADNASPADAPAEYSGAAVTGTRDENASRDDAADTSGGSGSPADSDGKSGEGAEPLPLPEPEAAPESAEPPVLDIDLEKSELTVEYGGKSVTEKLGRDDTLIWLRAVIEGGSGKSIDVAKIVIQRLEGADYAVYIYHDGSKLMGSLSEELSGGVELEKLSDFAVFEEMADEVK